MKELLLMIKERLIAGEHLVLVTVKESSGSVPRGAGARMLVGQGADSKPVRLWGSIGGGLTEHLAVEEAGQFLQKPKPAENKSFLKKYLLRPQEAAETGAVCGGEISVSFRFIGKGEEELLYEIEKELETDMARRGLVYVFGGGHVAQELLPLLVRLDFRCVVFDDREEFTRDDLFPGAEKIILGDFEHIERNVSLKADDFVVIITPGHLWDLEALAFALKSGASYIGVIGSKSKHEFIRERLCERGFSRDLINAPRVHAPIGLDIKSKTAAEISVSIAAELILERAQRACVRECR